MTVILSLSEPDAGDANVAPGPASSLWTPDRALVVFEDRPAAGWVAWLRPGFRHCFCALGRGSRWTILDPLKSGIAVCNLHGLTETDLARHYRDGGRRVLGGRVGAAAPPRGWPAFLRPLTCVELVKRTLNMHAPGVFTPQQLHRSLEAEHGFRDYILG